MIPTDELAELIRRAGQGDALAFAQLYDDFREQILRYLVHRISDYETAEDLTQQVFLKAWQAIPRYEHRGRPFSAWLYRIAQNEAIDHLRRHRPTADLERVDVGQPAEAERLVLENEQGTALQQILERLTEDHRQVLTLRFLMEMSSAEVSRIMGRKEVTIRGLQLRALRALRREATAVGMTQ